MLLLGLVYFSFQVYCDFSGYSDIAIGTSKLFGFELMSNFRFPVFSRDIREFWQKFHISMSSWFRDYLYMNLLMRLRGYGILGLIFATFFTYSLIGLWHGANFTFIVYGLVNAVYFLPIIIKRKKPYETEIFSSKSIRIKIMESFLCLKTWIYFSFSCCFFRSESITDSFVYIINIFTKFEIPLMYRSGILYIALILIFDFLFKNDERKPFNFHNKYLRYFFYIFTAYWIFVYFEVINLSEFIYFQF